MSGGPPLPAWMPVTDPSRVGEVRRVASSAARALGFDQTVAGKVAIAATELARNLVAHASGGEILLRATDEDERPGLEILALDRGPGIANLSESLRDGYSTAGTPGTGLGALTRLADVFDIHSVVGLGTVVVTRFLPTADGRPRRRSLVVGAVCVPRPGERVSGDAWSAGAVPGRALFLLSDGLGHGPAAADASRAAVGAFRRHRGARPASVLEAVHGALRGTRGAAVAVAELPLGSGVARFAGVGNIAGVILNGGAPRRLVSHNGIVGQALSRIHEFDYPWPAGALLVLASDGLTPRWSLDRYPGLLARHPSLIAGVLYRDFARGRDDTTVLVARTEGA